MLKKLAKLKYMPNKFEVIDDGDYVICAVSGKKISLDKLSYWNVDTQEAYYSYVEASIKRQS
tara:strand:+ start:170 stop:355 length:186 start_codon:yes stop_codon:yes gene_type:complete